MQIDDGVLAKLEKLSHLRIDPDKKEEIKDQLSDILSYIENLNELDTDALDPSFSTLSGGTPMRPDIPSSDPHIPREILDHSPRHADDFFVVPAIID